MNQMGGRSEVSPFRALSNNGSGLDVMAVLKAAQPAGLKPEGLLLFLNKRLREIRWKRSGPAETGDKSGRVRTIRPFGPGRKRSPHRGRQGLWIAGTACNRPTRLTK